MTEPTKRAKFHFKSRGLVLHAPVSNPAPERVLLSVLITAPESKDYYTITSAEVPFRFAGESREAHLYEIDPSPDRPAGAWSTADAIVFMTPEMASRLHSGELSEAQVINDILGLDAALLAWNGRA